MSSQVILTNGVAPSTPGSGKVTIYSKTSDKRLYYKDDAGAEVGPLTDSSGYVTPAQVQDSTYITLSSVAGTNTITATAPSPFSAYTTNQSFQFVASGTNTGAVTLNLNSLGAKSVTKNGTTPLIAGDITSGAVVQITYDGTRFQLLSGVGSNITAMGMFENNATISADYTITTGNNAVSAGPITINSGVSVTVPSGSVWTVV